MSSPVLQIRRGNATVGTGTVPALRPGEPAFSTNLFDLFVGFDTSVAGNKFFGSHRYWEREENGVKSLKLKLVSDNGSESINLRAPTGLGATFTYTLPATGIGNSGKVLSTDEAGQLSWVDSVNDFSIGQIISGFGTFTNNVAFTTTTVSTSSTTGGVVFYGGIGVAATSYFGTDLNVGGNLNVSGITSLGSNGFLDVNSGADFSGITTFSNQTNNTLGNSNTGAVQIDGGLGVDKNVTVGGNLNVQGYSEFVGIVTFKGGTIELGDSTGDNIYVGGEFTSNLVPNTTNFYDLGTSSQRWRDLWLSGNLTVAGVITATRYNDLLISNKDAVFAYIDGVSETDSTANHGGIAIASTEGTPLFDISVAGINTLPSTYKQIMWVKSGTFTGLSTDAWMFNYGVAIGTSTMASGVRLAVGTGITMSDTSISATNFYGTFNGTFNGSVVGVASTASTVETVQRSTDATHYLTFVDSDNASATAESLYTDAGVSYNPSTNNFKVAGLSSATAFVSTSSSLLAPTAGNYTGERLKLYDFNDPAKTNYAIGAEGSHVWFGVDQNNDAQGFKWYGHTTEVAKLGGTGNLTIAGDLTVSGNDIKMNGGTTALTFSGSGNVKTNGDLLAGSGYLAAADGTRAMYMFGATGIVSFQNQIIANNIRSSTNVSDTLTLSDLDATFAQNIKVTGITTTGTLVLNGTPGIGITGISTSTSLVENSDSYLPTQKAVKAYVDAVDLTLGLNADTGGPSTVNTSQTLTINGTANEVETSVSGQTVTVGLPDAVVVGTSLSTPTIRTNLIKSSDTNATAITITGDDVTIAGDLIVQGNTTQLDTKTLAVEDRTIELGKITAGQPSSTTWDLAVLFNYGDGTAKKAGLVWEASTSTRIFQFTTDVNPGADGEPNDTTAPSFSVTNFAPIEISELYINGCGTLGQQKVIQCDTTQITLQNITIDAGGF